MDLIKNSFLGCNFLDEIGSKRRGNGKYFAPCFGLCCDLIASCPSLNLKISFTNCNKIRFL